MKLATLSSFLILLCAPVCLGQAAGAVRIASVGPYPNVAPGQIIELRVEGVEQQLLSPPADGSLRVLVTQDGETRAGVVRTASPLMTREGDRMNSFQGLTFAVPKGLHAGGAEVVVSYRGRKSAPFALNVVERPLRPFVGTTAIRTLAPASLPPPPPAGASAARANTGLRFERGAEGVEVFVRPLADPEDDDAGVVVRFRQGGTVYDAAARVVHREGGRQDLPNGGFRLLTPRDVLEVDVPELLAPGEAELEVALRAGGQTGEPALVPVTITDAGRAYEAPHEAAPRMLAVTPRRVGAGQALMISVDRRRALDPDPSKALVVFEPADGARSVRVRPEMNSAVREPGGSPDLPVFLVARVPKQLSGEVRVRLLNPAREEYAGASSEAAPVEVTAEPVAPEVTEVVEAGEAEISHLRQLSAAQPRDPRVRPVYDPSVRYVAVRVKGLDPNPEFVRIRMEQEGGASVTLAGGDFALYSPNALIVRAPKFFGPGAVRVIVENRGANGYSAPAVRTFELSPQR